MAQTTKATRQNRTITVDFQDPSTYFQLISDGKAFVEFVLAFGDDGALWHAWQIDVTPFWSRWESLGSPPARIRAADRLTIGTNQDRRLEVFVVGQDGAVWHIWQIR